MDINRAAVTSRDGTTIGYRQLGHGPGLVIVHGSMSTGYNHIQLAERLADRFTVYLPDRRGRGLSGPYRPDNTLDTEVDDLRALLTKTGARDLVGISLGGIICLQAALSTPALGRVAAYEPPLAMKNSEAALRRMDAEMADGNVAAALVTAMKASQMGPRIFDWMPRWLLEPMTRRMTASMDRKGTGEYASFSALAPTLHHETLEIITAAANVDRFKAIRSEVLLIGGRKSAAHFSAALDRLAKILPRARRVDLPGVGHAAAWNADVGGKPDVVAQPLASFFLRSEEPAAPAGFTVSRG